MLDQMQISTLKFIYFLKTQFEERNERGATAVEYGLMVALIAAVIVGTVGARSAPPLEHQVQAVLARDQRHPARR